MSCRRSKHLRVSHVLRADTGLNCESQLQNTAAAPAPTCVGIILDGNRRWAKRNNLPATMGHRVGFRRSLDAAVWCETAGITNLTLWMLSVDNIRNRSSAELSALFEIIGRTMAEFLSERPWRLTHVGNLGMLPGSLSAEIRRVVSASADRPGMSVRFAIAHSGRQAVLSAIEQFCRRSLTSGLSLSEAAYALDEQHLDALIDPGQCAPQLIIRTSGEVRSSGFLAWSATGSVCHFTPSLWPEFDESDLAEAISTYARLMADNRTEGRAKP